jgi:hypothetical protein
MSKRAQNVGRKSSRKVSRLVLVTIMVAVFALGAMAAVSLRSGRAQQSTPPTTAKTSDARGNVNYRVGSSVPLNQQTGQVRPLTQEEAERLAQGLKKLVNQSTDGLQSVQHADGSVSMDLQGRFQNIAVAKRDDDGTLVQSCIDNPGSAAEFFGIDPQLVGVPKTTKPARTGAATLKGEDR